MGGKKVEQYLGSISGRSSENIIILGIDTLVPISTIVVLELDAVALWLIGWGIRGGRGGLGGGGREGGGRVGWVVLQLLEVLEGVFAII